METGEKLYLYPVWLRVWHGINALCIIALIYSGLSLHYSARSLFLMNFESAVNLHNVSGVIVSLNYFVFVLGNLFTKNGKYYRVKTRGLVKRVKKQAMYYLQGMFNGEEPPFPVSEKRKFNPLQKYSYIIVMYLFVPGVIITGFALLYPETIIDQVFQVSGVMLTAVLHSIIGFFIFIFLLVHLYVASLGKSPLNSYKSIITGWHA